MLILLLALSLQSAPAPTATPTPSQPRTIFLNINPSWSPDGRRLVFQSEREGHTQLYVIGADGSGERRLTWSLGEDTHPAWSPDGEWILFDSDRDGVWNLYAIHPDGTGERRLTHPAARAPTSSPGTRAGRRTGAGSSSTLIATAGATRTSTPPTRAAPSRGA
jgi:Tol biopolymer transport system component